MNTQGPAAPAGEAAGGRPAAVPVVSPRNPRGPAAPSSWGDRFVASSARLVSSNNRSLLGGCPLTIPPGKMTEFPRRVWVNAFAIYAAFHAALTTIPVERM